jgi:hypothetical protein
MRSAFTRARSSHQGRLLQQSRADQVDLLWAEPGRDDAARLRRQPAAPTAAQDRRARCVWRGGVERFAGRSRGVDDRVFSELEVEVLERVEFVRPAERDRPAVDEAAGRHEHALDKNRVALADEQVRVRDVRAKRRSRDAHGPLVPFPCAAGLAPLALPTADPFDGARPAKSGRQQIADGDLLHSALAIGGADRGAPQEAGNWVAVATVMTAIVSIIVAVVVPMTAIMSIIIAIIARLRRRDRREARNGRPEPNNSPDAVR